ncbi:hypothetical protein V8G54_002680 [Vigna mungo]|uniref:Uncharacterized protein n=1 Tax=Vigna mungo TaxID=3915 RepID=A0AAQ3SCV3_VIGMU
MLQKVTLNQPGMLHSLHMNNRNNMRNLAIIERQANILPSELLGDVDSELAVNGLAVHVEDGVGGGSVEHEDHKESGGEDDLGDEGPVFPGPAVGANKEGGPEEEGLKGREEEEGGGGDGGHSANERGASAERLEAPGGLRDYDDGGERPGDAEVEKGGEEEWGGEGEAAEEEREGKGEREKDEVGDEGGGYEAGEGGGDGEEGGGEFDGAAEEAVEDAREKRGRDRRKRMRGREKGVRVRVWEWSWRDDDGEGEREEEDDGEGEEVARVGVDYAGSGSLLLPSLHLMRRQFGEPTRRRRK